ncbi:MAG: LON peptidase substrate-binding domain-containing protein [Betaproteobacteria bacterium]
MKSLISTIPDSIRSIFKLHPETMADLPIFPLGSVLFPGGTMTLKIFEQRYLEMAKTCLKNRSPFGISLIRDGEEVGSPAVPEPVGTLAFIADWDMPDLGILQVRVIGAARFRIIEQSVSRNGLIVGNVSMLPDDSHYDCAEHIECASFLAKIYAKVASTEMAQSGFEDAAWVGYRLTEFLPFNNAVKQKMLELTDARIRLEILYKFLTDQRLIA